MCRNIDHGTPYSRIEDASGADSTLNLDWILQLDLRLGCIAVWMNLVFLRGSRFDALPVGLYS